jgi:glucose 1-dehydrogenase
MTPLAGKVALVTGASQGIGRAVAIALAAAGARVALKDLQASEKSAAASEEIQAAGGEAIVVPGDVADQQDVERCVDETVAAFGRLDIAVNSAAYSDRQPFYEADMAGFRRTIDVSMWGAFHLLRAASRRMIEQQQGGNVVLVSSPHAYVPVPRSMAYNMAKAAIEQMARTAAIELIEHRIRVNLVTPGWIDTPGERKFVEEAGIQKSAPKLPWKRLGRADEIARGVVFLCDPASDYITGSSILIDGGITLPWWASRGTGAPQ